MNDAQALLDGLREHQRVVAQLEALAPDVLDLARALRDAAASGGTIYWFGNGGSAADAQHLSAELVGVRGSGRRGLRSVALSTDTSLLTAVANDQGYERVFACQLETLARPGDAAIALSTSGASRNVIAGAIAARAAGARVIGLTGATGGELAALCDSCLRVPSEDTARVQECHTLIGHLVCALLDQWNTSRHEPR